MSKAIIVCGGRDFADYDLLKSEILKISPDFIIHGAAKGADLLAEKIAYELNISFMGFPADWDNLGKRAGPVRNKQMLDYLLRIQHEYDEIAVLAMPGGNGTNNMIEISKQANVKVVDLNQLR